jgi:hypothetical protein
LELAAHLRQLPAPGRHGIHQLGQLPLKLSAPLLQLLNLRGKLVPIAGRGRKSLLVTPSLLAHVI